MDFLKRSKSVEELYALEVNQKFIPATEVNPPSEFTLQSRPIITLVFSSATVLNEIGLPSQENLSDLGKKLSFLKTGNSVETVAIVPELDKTGKLTNNWGFIVTERPQERSQFETLSQPHKG